MPVKLDGASGEISFTFTSDDSGTRWGYRATITYSQTTEDYTDLKALFANTNQLFLLTELAALEEDGLDKLDTSLELCARTSRLDLSQVRSGSDRTVLPCSLSRSQLSLQSACRLDIFVLPAMVAAPGRQAQ